MGIFSSMDIAGTGLSAQRVRMDVISNNIANANTTRTPDGNAFRRSMAILRPRNDERVYRSPLLPESLQTPGCSGVKVVEIKEDTAPLRMVYDPSHPDADENGYVTYPNVSTITEMTNLIDASRAYEANVTAFDAAKTMALKGLEINK